ncbi:hypothetical protein CHELA41_23023 [Hyphomicrobiales bacterium]|nr:hypothetical protein CHELA41_23023 [Hyphomicrobiales bacterium]
MAVSANNDVIVHLDAQRFGNRNDILGHPDICRRRRGVSRGMVMEHPTVFIIILIFNDFFEEPLKVVPGFGSCT